jgi:UDP-N-acetylglucosamine transferase subunit ALG13
MASPGSRKRASLFWQCIMIFVTVGTDQPFDRMLRVIDSWARENLRKDVFAQIGKGAWEPEYIDFAEFLEPSEFQRRLKDATLVISHAGMGTILTALLNGKTILVMPKLALLGEHRNEHQSATVRKMMNLGNVNVAFDEDELRQRLEHLDQLKPPTRIGVSASESLISGLHGFIHQEKPQA